MKKGICSKMGNSTPREQLIAKMNAIKRLISEKTEEWVPLVENSQYLISNHGRVKNLKSFGQKPRILTLSIRLNKYLYVTISVGNKRKTVSINKLLLKYFSQ